jgi:hypothetical protein
MIPQFPRDLTTALCAALLVSLLPVSTAAQTPNAHTLSNPDARFETGLSQITGLVERSDGELVVTDLLEHAVYRIDEAFEASTLLGGHGTGPREYLGPGGLFDLGADRVLMYDVLLGRMLEFGPDFQPGGEFIHPRGCPEGGSRMNPAEAVDRAGHFYALTRPISGEGGALTIVDSVGLERWSDPVCQRDTLAIVPFPGATERFTVVQGGPAPQVVEAFSASPRLAVAPDGRLGVVSPDPFEVRFFDEEGGLVVRTSVPIEPIPVTEEVREAWRETQSQPRPGRVRDRGGDESRVQMTTAPELEPEWPEALPPYTDGHIGFDRDGCLWIERLTAPGAPARFERISVSGEPIRPVEGPENARLLGFGEGVVYLAETEEITGLEYLTRYRAPECR